MKLNADYFKKSTAFESWAQQASSTLDCVLYDFHGHWSSLSLNIPYVRSPLRNKKFDKDDISQKHI